MDIGRKSEMPTFGVTPVLDTDIVHDGWRHVITHEARKNLIRKIANDLWKHLSFAENVIPPPEHELAWELMNVATTLEETFFLDANSMNDYIGMISFKMFQLTGNADAADQSPPTPTNQPPYPR